MNYQIFIKIKYHKITMESSQIGLLQHDRNKKRQAIHRAKVAKHQKIFKVIKLRCFLMKVTVNYHYRKIRNKKRKK